MRSFRFRIPLLVLGLAGLACPAGPDTGDRAAFEAAIPRASTLVLSMPEAPADATGKPGAIREALHATAAAAVPSFVDLTLQAMEDVNGDLALLLLPLATVSAAADPVFESPDTAVWRIPDDGGEEHLLAIDRRADGTFILALASRSLDAVGAAWRPRIAGTWTPDARPELGQGALWIDLGADLDPATSGKVLVLWSVLPSGREIAVFEYDLVRGPADVAPRNGTSRFLGRPEGSGEFAFSGPVVLTDADGAAVAVDQALVVARWTSASDGRADVLVTGSAAAEQGFDEEVAAQCWKALGNKTTYDSIEGHVKKPKDDKTDKKVIKSTGRVEDCPFLEPADALLPSRPDEPPPPPLPDLLA